MEVQKLDRYVPPTRFECQPYGTIWVVNEESANEYTYYIQISRIEDQPDWITVAELLNRLYKKYYEDDSDLLLSLLDVYAKDKDIRELFK